MRPCHVRPPPERISIDDAMADSRALAAVVPGPSVAVALRDELGFGGEVYIGIQPGKMSGVPPGEAEAAVLNAGFQPLAIWPVMFTQDSQIRTHKVLRKGYLAIERKRVSASEFCGAESVMPDAAAFQRAFRGAGRALANNRRPGIC